MYVNGGSMMAIGIAFPVLSAVTVVGRFWARLERRVGLRSDDWLCLSALAFVIATGTLITYASAKGSFDNLTPPITSDPASQDQIDNQQLLPARLHFVIQTMNPIGTGLIRLSFLFFYRRLFRGRVFSLVNWLVILIVIVWMVTWTIYRFAVYGSTLPLAWKDPSKAGTHARAIVALSITAVVLDLVILTIPVYWIWRLHLPAAQKRAVCSVFLVGFLAVGASIMRIYVALQILVYESGSAETILGLNRKDYDVSAGLAAIWIFWQFVEHGVGMIVCCLPALKALSVNKHLAQWLRKVSQHAFQRLHFRKDKDNETSLISTSHTCQMESKSIMDDGKVARSTCSLSPE